RQKTGEGGRKRIVGQRGTGARRSSGTLRRSRNETQQFQQDQREIGLVRERSRGEDAISRNRTRHLCQDRSAVDRAVHSVQGRAEYSGTGRRRRPKRTKARKGRQ